jgi:hypothetical protein
MALDRELGVYNDNLTKLMEQTGKFVLIHGDDIVDYFAAYEDAIKAGYQRFGLEPFLVKQINAVQAVQHISRSILPFSQSAATVKV